MRREGNQSEKKSPIPMWELSVMRGEHFVERPKMAGRFFRQ
jgi:hypothetical protein